MTAGTDHAAAYDASRQRIAGLVTAPGADVAAPVPACPGWTVGDVVAHLAGGIADFAARRFDGVDTGEWGERQVRDRRGRTVAANLAEWDENLAAAGPLLDSPMAGVLLAEVVSHEHDIRGALGEPGARDDPAIMLALQRPLAEIDKRLRETGTPALRIVTPDGEQVVGAGEPAGTLRISSFELLRALGRRSRDQRRRYDWDTDPTPWLDTLAFLGTRDTDLTE